MMNLILQNDESYLNDKISISEFIELIHQDTIIIIDDAERLPNGILIALIDLCHMAKNDHHHSSSSPRSVKISLLLGITISSIQSLQMDWSHDHLLKIVSNGAKLCDIQEILNLYGNKLLSIPELTTACPIEPTFIDFSRDDTSLHLFQRHIQCYIKLHLSVSPFPLYYLPICVTFNKRQNENIFSEVENELFSDQILIIVESEELGVYHQLEKVYTIIVQKSS